VPNSIKYSVSAQTLALKKGNFWIGTGDVGKGPTSTTDYWNGITPPSGGYTIYLNKASQGPAIFTAGNDAALISLTNRIAGANYTTAAECFEYFRGQTDKLVMNYDLPGWCTDGLQIVVDAAWVGSYPKTGNNWYDTQQGITFVADNNQPVYVNSSPFYWDFENSRNPGDNLISSVGTGTYDQTQYTRCAWFNPESFDNFTTFMGIFQNQYGNNGDMALSIGKPDNVSLYYVALHQYANTVNFGSSLDVQLMGTTALSINTWYFGSVSYNRSTETAKVYLNGVLENTYTGIKWGNAAGDNIMIGGPDNDGYSGGRMFDGKIGWAAHYNKILTDAQILSTFNDMKSRFGL
jgi:hypothetical protein